MYVWRVVGPVVEGVAVADVVVVVVVVVVVGAAVELEETAAAPYL